MISVFKKISAPFVLINILVALLIFITYHNFVKTIDTINSIENETDKRTLLDNIRYHISKSLRDANGYIITEDKKYSVWHNESINFVNNNLSLLAGLDQTEEEKQLISELYADVDSIDFYSDMILAKPNPKSSSEVPALMEKIGFKFGESAFEKIDKLFTIIFFRTSGRFDLIRNFKESALENIYILSIVTFVISVLVAVLAAKGISRPITALLKSSKSIAAGNYDDLPNVHMHDEIGELSKTIREIAESIKKSKE